MSTMLLGTDLTDLLVTAAVRAGVVTAAEAPALGAALVRENSDAYLWDCFDGPEVIADWDDLDEDEQDDEELQEVVALRRGYAYRPVPAERVADAAVVRRAVETWCYQADSAPRYTELPGWQAMQRLLAALGTDASGEARR